MYIAHFDVTELITESLEGDFIRIGDLFEYRIKGPEIRVESTLVGFVVGYLDSNRVIHFCHKGVGLYRTIDGRYISGAKPEVLHDTGIKMIRFLHERISFAFKRNVGPGMFCIPKEIEYRPSFTDEMIFQEKFPFTKMQQTQVPEVIEKPGLVEPGFDTTG